MTALGPFLFAAPWALAALVALPALWWILRATPPAPKQVELPSIRLLEGIEPREETPARTPWWIWLIRTLATIALILGLAQPVYAPGANQQTDEDVGSLLVVVDNGWASAPRWSELINAATATLDAGDRDMPVHLLLTAPQQLNIDPSERLSRTDMAKRLTSLEPQSWGTDRADAGERLEASRLRPDRIFWASDGLAEQGGEAFADQLANLAPLTVYAAPPKGAAVISAIESQTDQVTLDLNRVSAGDETRTYVSAQTLDGGALATAEVVFAAGELSTQTAFKIPAAALARVAQFRVTRAPGAGTVWLWDSTDRTRRVGVVETGGSAQPLLSDMHYIRKALEPFATITEGTIEDLVALSPDAIIMSDVGQILASDAQRLEDWVASGGALIRFAGPSLAAQGDTLLPVPLRRSSRALGGALAWDEPQALAEFPETSPFAGLSVPHDIRIRQQVLARPGPDLASKTWARLEDGSPLVTADQRGSGMLILFHTTAGPDWGDLSYAGAYSQMLRRAIAAGRGDVVPDTDGSYAPLLTLDGFGQLERAGPQATPIKAPEFADIVTSETRPPGLYQGPGGTRAVNAGAQANLTLIDPWPASAVLLGDAEARALRLTGPLLASAALLLAFDLFIALMVAGVLPRLQKSHATVALLLALMAGGALSTQTADAQPAQYRLMPDGTYRRIASGPDIVRLPAGNTATEDIDAALDMRFGYVLTQDRALNERTRAGLAGLSEVLNLRTSVEPAEPHGLNLETDSLELYPLIYFNVPDTSTPLPETAIARLNGYLRSGGALIIDTRAGGTLGSETDVGSLESLLEGLDAPPLQPVDGEHVLARSFYLLTDFPGRYAERRLWIEQTGTSGAPRGDGVSRLFIGDADWASAWATDAQGRELYSVDGGNRQREMARRFGVNLVMYVLTGNYKNDQVHIPALLERLGGTDEEEGLDLPLNIMDGGPQ